MQKNDKYNWTRTDNSSAFVKAFLRLQLQKVRKYEKQQDKII